MATGIGETLRAARRQQGVALADAAAETRVREAYLAALEEEDFAALGGDVYVKGFLRSYARFLGLDPAPLIAAYRDEHERGSDDFGHLTQQPVGPMSDERRSGLVVAAGIALLVVVVLGLIGLLGDGRDGDESELAAAPPPVTETAPDDTGTTDPVAGGPTEEPQPTQAPTPDATEELQGEGVDLRLDVNGGESWMRVVVDGERQIEGIQPDGTRLSFRADDSITVRIGDASVVEVTVNGESRGTLGGPAEVVTRTFTAEDAA